MKLINAKRLLIVTFILGLFTSHIIAQEGAVQGVIVDNYGIYVPGASIEITSLKKGTVSNQNGKFTIVNVPEGSHTILIKYLGFSDKSVEVKVDSKQTTSIVVELSPSDVVLDDVEVVGNFLGGQARALNTQKNNPNITNVVSTEQIGKFPDANVGDALKRIPGITMQVDQGEARNIIIRGLAPQLNSVTLNGSRIPSAEGDNRNVQMDLIPSDMIQTIEVNKAVTPDMDADALGGSVNLVTRSTPQDFRLSVTAGSGVNTISDKAIYNGSFILGDRSANKKFGWMISASINDNDFGSDNVEAEWTDEFEYNTGNQDADGEDILEEMEVNPYANVFEIRKYLVQRIRRSFAANVDYEFDDNNYVFLKTMYNWRDDRENRYRQESEILDGDDISQGDFIINNGNLVRFPVESKRQTKGGIDNKRSKNRRLEDQRMQNYSLGGEHLFGSLQVDWLTSYAKASEERPDERYLEYEGEYSINNEINSREPYYSPVDDADLALNNFEFGELTEEHQYTDEKDFNFFANFTLPADLFNNGDGNIKFGVKSRYKKKERDNNFYEYEPLSGLQTLADVRTQDYSDTDFTAGDKYQVGIFASSEYLGNLNLNNSSSFEREDVPDEYLTANYNVDETVYAGYIMVDQKLTNKLSLLAGVRLENTKVESVGNELTLNDDGDFEGSMEVKGESSYQNIMPGLHFKYNLNEKTILRLAWTNTLARPNYEDLVPSSEINQEDEEIIVGNADLDPTTSMNFDFMAEYYFQNVGILSGGVFYKDIDQFIYTFTYEDAATGFDVFTPLNGDNAYVYGAEVSLQRQLDFLPGFAKNFGVYLNYTYLNSNANGIRNEDGDERGDLELPGATPNMFNGSLSYSGKRFTARLSANYSDAYLDELGGNGFEDRYYDDQFFLDFNAAYAINKNLRVYADITNITNQPLRYYQGVRNRTMQMEYYRSRINLGLKYDLF